MNLVPRLAPYLSEGAVRNHYDTVAFGTFGAIWRRRGLILAVTALGLALGVLALLVLKKSYTADALIQLDFGREEGSRSGPAAGASGPALDAAALVESEARVLRSRAIARRVVDQLGLLGDPDFLRLIGQPAWTTFLQEGIKVPAGPDGDAVRSDLIALALLRNLTVTNDTRAYLINVAYTAADAGRAASIVNTFTDEYLRNRMEVSLNAAQRTSTWLSAQIQQTRAALDEAETQVNASRRYSDGPAAADGGAGQDQQIQDFARRFEAANRARDAEAAKLARLRAILTADATPTAEELAETPALKGLVDQREALSRDRETADADRTASGEAAGASGTAEARWQAERAELIADRERATRTATAVAAAIGSRLQELKDAAVDAKKRESRLRSLQLDAASLRDRLKLLTENYSQAVAAAGLKSANAQVVMRAEPIPLPSGPNVPLILGLALIGSAGAGTAAALLLEKRKTGFKSEADLASETQAPCLAMIPDLPTVPTLGQERIFGEAIGLACAGLGIPASSGTTRVLLLTSSVPGEGKSGFGRAIAGALARKQMRTLIIDVLPPQPGRDRTPAPSLDEVLLNDPDGVFERHAGDSVVRLQASGRMTTSEMQADGRLARLLQAARTRFHLVILEAPPVLLMLDFLPLAGFADTVVHLVRWNSTPRRTVAAALRRLDQLSVSLQGVVLTRVDLKAHGQHFIVDQCEPYSKYRRFYDRREPGPAPGRA